MNTVQTDDAPRAIGPYSQAVQVDGWLYASGQSPMTPAGDGGGRHRDTDRTDLQQHRSDPESRRRVAVASRQGHRVFVQDLNYFAQLNAVYERRFAGHKPARSTVEVARLPRDARVEIEIIARLA